MYKLGVMFLWLTASVAVSSMASELTLRDVQAKLGGRGASWTAGATSVSGLPLEAKKRLLGANLPEGFEDYFRPAVDNRHSRALPEALDWRNKDGVNYASPILDQGDCGSCVAFATIGTLETQMNITRKTPFSPWQFSPQHLFACGGGGCSMGWMPGSAINFLKTRGVPDEACFPYQSGATGQDLSCSATCSDAKERSTKIVGSSMPTFFFMSVDKVKQALQHGPLLTTMMVYEDFFFYKSGVYKHVTGKLAGGHAVSIIGYDDQTKSWIVRNSWGKDWGEAGFFRIDWDDASGVGRMSYSMEVGDANGYVAIQNLREKAVFRGKVPLTFASTYANTQQVEYTLSQHSKVAAHGLAEGLKADLDTTSLADGAYQLSATAKYRDGLGKSQPRTVYIANGPLSGSVKFTSVKPNDTFKGRTEIHIAVKGQPVPLTQLVVKLKNTATGVVTVKSTRNIADALILGWRTQVLPNGNYELSAEGFIGDNSVAQSETVPVKLAN